MFYCTILNITGFLAALGMTEKFNLVNYILMQNLSLFLILFFLAINLMAFLIMLLDKNKSKGKGVERISEGMLFFLATIFGSVGVLAGMFVFRHKTQKWYFLIGIPFLILQNVALLYLFYLLLNGFMKF